jgi:hypothetical protein
MPRLSPFEFLLRNLEGIPDGMPRDSWYMSQERAYSELKRQTGQDFGYDVDAWAQWLDANKVNWRFASKKDALLSRIKGL